MIHRRRVLQGALLLSLGVTERAVAALHRTEARLIILGGGFAGLNAAFRLRRLLPGASISLIDPSIRHYSCPGSNAVIAGLAPLEHLIGDSQSALQRRSIRVIREPATRLEAARQMITLRDGSRLPYDRLILAPGIGFRFDTLPGYDAASTSKIPHAWQAGPQTDLLRRQVNALRPGGVVLITAPENPYRCPPGPYERATLIAHALKIRNPRAKIILLDAKSRFPKEKAFRAAWQRLYPGMIEWISFETTGALEHLDSRTQTLVTEFDRFSADVLNLIPPQKAAPLTEQWGLTDRTGWCPVSPLTYESRLIPKVHVIGDSAALGPVPKSAFSAQAEGRLCALAVASLLNDLPLQAPRLINHCYSAVGPDQAISVTGVYGLNAQNDAFATQSLAETAPTDDWFSEAVQARDWLQLLQRTTFEGL